MGQKKQKGHDREYIPGDHVIVLEEKKARRLGVVALGKRWEASPDPGGCGPKADLFQPRAWR